jgi:hypothetical protein
LEPDETQVLTQEGYDELHSDLSPGTLSIPDVPPGDVEDLLLPLGTLGWWYRGGDSMTEL